MTGKRNSDPATHPPEAIARAGVLAPAWLRLPGSGLAGVLALAATFVSSMHVVLAVVSTLLFGYALARRLGMTAAQGVLSGGAVAICGASAALAIAAVLPRNKESERFTLVVVVTVTVLSTIAMVLYPLITRLLQLPPDLAGLFLGGTIHDVAQVAGAGYMLNQETGDYAVIVKLFRVAMLAVIVIAVSAMFRSQREISARAEAGSPQRLVPWFLWVFVALVVLNSAGGVPATVQDGLNWISRACLVVAIVALGMKTSFEEIRCFGWRPLVMLLSETVWMAAFVLILIMAGGAA